MVELGQSPLSTLLHVSIKSYIETELSLVLLSADRPIGEVSAAYTCTSVYRMGFPS